MNEKEKKFLIKSVARMTASIWAKDVFVPAYIPTNNKQEIDNRIFNFIHTITDIINNNSLTYFDIQYFKSLMNIIVDIIQSYGDMEKKPSVSCRPMGE